MKITKISYSEAQTVTVRRFEAIKPIVSAEMELNETDDPTIAMLDLRAFVKTELAHSVNKIKAMLAGEKP